MKQHRCQELHRCAVRQQRWRERYGFLLNCLSRLELMCLKLLHYPVDPIIHDPSRILNRCQELRTYVRDQKKEQSPCGLFRGCWLTLVLMYQMYLHCRVDRRCLGPNTKLNRCRVKHNCDVTPKQQKLRSERYQSPMSNQERTSSTSPRCQVDRNHPDPNKKLPRDQELHKYVRSLMKESYQ